MRIVVPIKPVEDAGAWTIGSLDVYALSHALAMRDAVAGTVHVVVAGSASAASTVAQRALATGADEATVITVENPGAIDALALAGLLADAIRPQDADLVLCGQTSDDIETGVIGGMLAELLDREHVSTVTAIETGDGTVRVRRDVVGGSQTIDVPLPAVLVVLSGRSIVLRYPTPRGMIAARKKPVSTNEGSPTLPDGIAWSAPQPPERKGDGEILRDLPAADAARRIADWLVERGLTG